MSVVIETGFNGITQPIDQPRLCFDAHPATGTATSTADGYDENWIADGETWSVWQADGNSATLTISFTGGAQTCSYAGLAAHNLGTIGASVTCRVGGVTVGSISPGDDNALLFLFLPRTASTVQFTISGSDAPRVAVASAGEVLEMPQLSTYTGLPISESKQVRYRHQQSITGDVLGRAIEGAELRFDLTVQNLPETFRAAAGDVTWKGFLRHVDDGKAFFIAAKPLSYPDDMAYARASERPRFTRERPNFNNAGAVTFQCVGYAAP